MARKSRKLDFEALYAKGENPRGMTAQTANGTAHAVGTGWNKQYDWGFDNPQVPEGGTWQGPNSNRTGE